jgi:hypothetical protein
VRCGFERTRGDQRVHADASHGSAVDIDGIDFARGHDFVDLLVDSIERNTFRRIDFHANHEFAFLQLFPEFALGFALQSGGRLCYSLDVTNDGCLHWPQRLHRFGHGADVRGRGAAAAAENAHPESGGFAGEKREIFGRGFRVHDAVAFALGETGVGHAANAETVHAREFLKNGKQRLRAERAIGADDLHVFVFQLRGHRAGTQVAEDRAFLGVGKLRDDGKPREGTNGVDG